MIVSTKYISDEDGVVVHVNEVRDAPGPQKPGPSNRERTCIRHFGKSAKAEDDGLIFVHGVNHGEIKLDDILPPWAD